MRQDTAQLLGQLAGDSPLAFEQILWGALIAGLAFSIIHLVTMLVTRWGDSAASTKSLIFSVLVHLVLILSLVVFQPQTVLPVAAKTEAEPEPIQVRDLSAEGPEETQDRQRGNTPVWEQPSEPPEKQFARMDRLPFEPAPVQSPERQRESRHRPGMDGPEMPSLPDQRVVMPEPQRAGQRGPRRVASIPQTIDEPTAEARPEVERPSISANRQPIRREGQLDEEVSRRVRRGTVDRVEPDVESRQTVASIDAPVDPKGFLKRGPVQESIRRRTGPAPPLVPDDETGAPAEREGDGTAGAAPVTPNVRRLPTRTPRSRDDGSVERFHADRPPRTPAPAEGPEVAVRENVPVETPHPGPVPPNVVRPDFESIRNSESVKLPATYRLRDLARREEIARRFGGTEESERAVEASLAWLAGNQTPAGYWDADRFEAGQVKIDERGVDRQHAGRRADTGLTALATLAFLSAGYTHEEGQYADTVRRALQWLIRQQQENGYLGGEASHYAKMYCHGMATYALAEAYGMQSDPTLETGLREPLTRAVGYILDNQNPEDGGWRYIKGQKGDMSMFGWQLMALRSAEIAGIDIPEDAREKMIQFLKDRSLGEHQGLAGYREDMPATASMTAEALFSKQMLGIRRENPASKEAVDYLLDNLPTRSEYNVYYWYYGSLALFQYGGEPWRKWNETLRDLLVADQRDEGELAGSWDPVGRWGRYGGRIYSTALSTLCLEVYYKILPLYEMGGRYGEE